jgi:hypothetical protein
MHDVCQAAEQARGAARIGPQPGARQ